ncbi:MAG: hypothetical protein J6A17_01900 [Bacilli bacterium]|nr:hypothetical protein [Bacilli bacterium]
MTKKEEKKVVRKRKTTKKKKEEFSNDSFMLTMLLTVTCLLLTSLKAYQFTLFDQTLTFSVLILPIVIFISNYITKKEGFKNSLYSVIISSLMVVAFLLLIENLTNQKANVLEIFGYSLSCFVSLFINLSIYYYILINMSYKSIMIGLNYMFTIVLNSFIHLLFFNELVLTNSFWGQFTIAIIIQFILSIILICFDRKIERGIEK